jgi:hypothetical protein
MFTHSSGALGLVILAVILFGGHYAAANDAGPVLFGAYHGTVRKSGFFWANPFYSRGRARIPLGNAEQSGERSKAHGVTLPYRTLSAKISLRARNFNSEKLKVNDKRGNPVEIAAVIVWRSRTPPRPPSMSMISRACKSERIGHRHVASLYAYDRSEDEGEPTLRDSADEVAQGLQNELQVRLAKAGVTVDEARLTHLAYAPEIAQAMLRRQQAEAVIAARTKIVHGAVSMVDMALKELSAKGVVMLDEERKATMVSNLLVVLCGESEVTPVVNTGTLYN